MTSVQQWTGRAAARVGLLGNPSDGYGGRVIAMTVPTFEAAVRVGAADEWQLAGDDQTGDGAELLAGTVELLTAERPALVTQPGRITFSTTIPRQVGLSGSSAIIIATLRALAKRKGDEWDPVELARLALTVETDVLGWAAGPQDRVVQSYDRLIDMDFAQPWDASRYVPLDGARLPPLFVAWNRSMGAPSTVAHTDVRARWDAGDQQVRSVMTRFAELAVEGRKALDQGQAASIWPALIDEAFELRSQIWKITDVDTELVETGRAGGAGVAFAGSGGAVVGAVRDATMLDALATAYQRRGAGFLVLSTGSPA